MGKLREDFKEEIQEQERKMEAAMTKGETQTNLFILSEEKFKYEEIYYFRLRSGQSRGQDLYK